MFSGDLEALKVKDPSLSPRGLLGLKEARGEGRSFKCGETVGKCEDAAMHKDRRRGKLALSIIEWDTRAIGRSSHMI